ncbi:MAG: hypothetical protein IKV03_02600 [Alphaproteobacteria bacterium]|nr:hypothetical protein [Alphaproteobacteria bacterium]
MFKKIAVFTFFFCFGFGYTITPLKSKVHIYIDYATTPTLLQMIDLIKQPKEDLKFIFWRRFPNLNKNVNLADYNTTQIELPPFEGANRQSQNIIKTCIQHIYDNTPDADYTIHVNLWWATQLIPILQIIDPTKIEHIHIYEDGISNVIHSRKDLTLSVTPHKKNYANLLKKIIVEDGDYTHEYDFVFHTLYPTTYHLSFVDMIKKDPSLNDFINFLDLKNIKEINWYKLKNSLTDREKQQLFSFINFDIHSYKEKISNKKVDFFLLRGSYSTTEEQIKTVSTLFKHQNLNRVLVLKEHPNLTPRIIASKIQKNIPEAIIFPKHIPFEILILADLIPDTISGYSTSVFFLFPSEKIKYYISSDRDSYLHFLKELNIITDEKIIESMKDTK